MRKNGKKILIAVISGVLVIAITAGLLTVKYYRNHRPTVYAAIDWVRDMAYFSDDSSYSYGTVAAEGIQPINISSTQTVKEVYVTEGQEVHVGDPLVAFDTTLSEIDLEKKSIEISQLELDLQNLNTQLSKIDNYLIGSDTSYSYSYTYSTGTLEYPPYMPYLTSSSTVGTQDDPIVYLWNDDCVFNDGFVRQLVQLAMDTRAAQQDDPDADDDSDGDADIDPDSGDDAGSGSDEPEEGNLTVTSRAKHISRARAAEVPPVQDEETESETGSEQESGIEPDAEEYEPEPESESESEYEPEPESGSESEFDPESDPETDPEYQDDRVYAVFEVRGDDSLNGTVERSWEIAVTSYSDGSWDIHFIEPVYESAEEVYTETVTYDYIDTNEYHTAADAAAEREQCEKEIRDKTLALETAKVDYKRLEYEMQNGVIYSELDGTVKTLRDADEAQKENLPLVLVSAGGGYYITASIGEYDLQSVQVGDIVQVDSYEDGISCSGEIVEISPYAEENTDSWVNGGSTNISWYPIKVFVSEDAALREDSYVEVVYSGSDSESGSVYLYDAFIRDEDGESCIYVVGEDGRLERRVVRTGAGFYGLTEIVQGLTIDECYDLYIAYLYDGSRIRDGAAVQYGTDSYYYYY